MAKKQRLFERWGGLFEWWKHFDRSNVEGKELPASIFKELAVLQRFPFELKSGTNINLSEYAHDIYEDIESLVQGLTESQKSKQETFEKDLELYFAALQADAMEKLTEVMCVRGNQLTMTTLDETFVDITRYCEG